MDAGLALAGSLSKTVAATNVKEAWLKGALNLCPGCGDSQPGTDRCTDCLEWDAECRDKAEERGDE